MPNDSTLKSVFDWAKVQLSAGEFPQYQAVYFTWVQHDANSHPPHVGTPAGSPDSSDLVLYANGKFTLSGDKHGLSGEAQIWRNIDIPSQGGFFGTPVTPEDEFADSASKFSIAINVTDSGKCTYQRKINGAPIGGLGMSTLNASYKDGLFVETSGNIVTSLSFTLSPQS